MQDRDASDDCSGRVGGNPMRDKPHLLIAGAGIGGLTAALGLLRQGFAVSVYEQAKELREVGAGVLISPNGMRALTSLGVAERALAVAAHPAKREVRLWKTGQAWPTFELNTVAATAYGYPFAWLFRPDLLDLLAEAVTDLAPDAIHLGYKVTSCKQDAEGSDITVYRRRHYVGRRAGWCGWCSLGRPIHSAWHRPTRVHGLYRLARRDPVHGIATPIR